MRWLFSHHFYLLNILTPRTIVMVLIIIEYIMDT